MFRRSLIPILLVSHLVLAQSDLELINTRRQADLAQFPNQQQIDSIPIWLSTQQSDGTWSDVNYLAGCDARMFNVSSPLARVLIGREGELADTESLDKDYLSSCRMVGCQPGHPEQLHRRSRDFERCVERTGLLVCK